MTGIYQDFQDTLLWDQITLESSAWKSTMLLLRMTLFMNVKLDLLWTTNQLELQPHSMLCVSDYYNSNFLRRPQSIPLLRPLLSKSPKLWDFVKFLLPFEQECTFGFVCLLWGLDFQSTDLLWFDKKSFLKCNHISSLPDWLK